MKEEEIQATLGEKKNDKKVLNLTFYHGTKTFKSIRRAMRRGHVSDEGRLYPKRPFNNRKNKPLEDEKRRIYEDIKRYRTEVLGRELQSVGV